MRTVLFYVIWSGSEVVLSGFDVDWFGVFKRALGRASGHPKRARGGFGVVFTWLNGLRRADRGDGPASIPPALGPGGLGEVSQFD